MPKTQSSRLEAKQRHNPLAEVYSPSQPLKQKAGKKRKVRQIEDEDGVVGSKASRRILEIGQELVDEEDAERKKNAPNPAFDFGARLAEFEDDEDEVQGNYEDDEEAWGSEEEIVEEIEIDPNDQDIFNRFLPSTSDPVDLDLTNLLNPSTSTSNPSTTAQNAGGTNLADLILSKIAAHEAATASGQPTSTTQSNTNHPADIDTEADIPLPPKVVEVYTTIGDLLSRHRSGALPKPFKVLPSLPAHQIPVLIHLTRPESWTPHVYFLATKLFISAAPATAQPFLTTLLLPRVRDEIQETKKLHVHLYSALKKSLYKPACFFKGILFPLLADGTCTLREAQIIGSVVARVSVPVLHSAAALLRLCDIAAEQFSARKEDGGGGATNIFIKTLLEKKYALPYKVVDALVFHFLRFRAIDQDAIMQIEAHIQKGAEKEASKGLPVLWHQSFLAFAETYKNDITEDQREALLDLVNAKGHYQIGPEVRRQLLAGRGRGVPEFVEDVTGVVGGDDTMMMGMGVGVGQNGGGSAGEAGLFGKAAGLLGDGVGAEMQRGHAMVVG